MRRSGYLHTSTPERQALVLDLMEPQRPIVDRAVLEFVQAHTFHPADFTIRSDGACRLNPEMAKRLAVDSSGLNGLGRSISQNLRFRPLVQRIICTETVGDTKSP
jgi:CRISPR/Cas system-associated endonuclease Cas1